MITFIVLLYYLVLSPTNASVAIECTKPANWCTHYGSTYEYKDCDGDGLPDPVCSDKSNNFGVIQTSKDCQDSWPNGICLGQSGPDSNCNPDFVDSYGFDCEAYKNMEFCTTGGKVGDNWGYWNGDFEYYEVSGEDAWVCPECGCDECSWLGKQDCNQDANCKWSYTNDFCKADLSNDNVEDINGALYPTEGETCVDSAWGAGDAYGDHCNEYHSHKSWCGTYDDSDFDSEVMCCACGGGIYIDTCTDMEGILIDANGNNCDQYTQNSDNCGSKDTDTFDSFSMCCACGGGNWPTIDACQMFSTKKTCLASEEEVGIVGCLWDKDTKTCAVKPCDSFKKKNDCNNSGLNCAWSKNLKICVDHVPTCAGFTTKSDCTTSDKGMQLDCHWNKETKTCTEFDLGCTDYITKGDCINSDKGIALGCGWDAESKTCSVYDPVCTDFTAKGDCTKSDLECAWNTDSKQCGEAECVFFTTKSDCVDVENGVGMECEWNADENKCDKPDPPGCWVMKGETKMCWNYIELVDGLSVEECTKYVFYSDECENIADSNGDKCYCVPAGEDCGGIVDSGSLDVYFYEDPCIQGDWCMPYLFDEAAYSWEINWTILQGDEIVCVKKDCTQSDFDCDYVNSCCLDWNTEYTLEQYTTIKWDDVGWYGCILYINDIPYTMTSGNYATQIVPPQNQSCGDLKKKQDCEDSVSGCLWNSDAKQCDESNLLCPDFATKGDCLNSITGIELACLWKSDNKECGEAVCGFFTSKSDCVNSESGVTLGCEWDGNVKMCLAGCASFSERTECQDAGCVWTNSQCG